MGKGFIFSFKNDRALFRKQWMKVLEFHEKCWLSSKYCNKDLFIPAIDC